jgi:hypothetical protein
LNVQGTDAALLLTRVGTEFPQKRYFHEVPALKKGTISNRCASREMGLTQSSCHGNPQATETMVFLIEAGLPEK